MISLVPFEPNHFEALLSWFPSDRDLVQWAGPTLKFPLDSAQLSEMLRAGQTQPPSRLCWSAVAGREIVGHAQLGLDHRNGNGNVSRIAVAPSQRGKGIAFPMLKQVVDRAFELPWIERLELNVYAFNAPAIRTYERIGFVTEGNRRSSALVDGERWDTIIMGLLRSEWTGD